jgi:hypothetical protein
LPPLAGRRLRFSRSVLLFLSRDPAVRRRKTAAPSAPIVRCAGPRGALRAFPEAELAAAPRRLLRRHLAWCAVCRAQLAQTRALRAAIVRASPVVAAPAALRARVQAELGAARAAAGAASPSSR